MGKKFIGTNKFQHLLLVSLPPIIGIILTLNFSVPFIVNILFFYLVPVIILAGLNGKPLVKSLLFALLMQIPIGIFLDYILTKNTWEVKSIFPSRIFGIIPYEDIIWGFMLFLYVVYFYEYFLDKPNVKTIKNRVVWIFPLVMFSTFLFLALLLINPELKIPYVLHLAGIPVLLIPTTIFLASHRHLILPILTTGVYFFLHSFILEVISLRTDQWIFHGDDFIGWVSVMGVSFPFEEFFYWFVILASAIVVYYEFLWDDRA